MTISKREYKGCSKSPNQKYINSKIYEANTLIDRVKDTLYDIKNTAKVLTGVIEEPLKLSADKETCTEEAFVSQVVYDDTADTSEKDSFSSGAHIGFSRPITRRKDTLYLAHLRLDKGNKFQNTVDDKIDEDEGNKAEEMTSLECLQLKLNTINEQAESDLSSSNSERKVRIEEEKVTTTTTCCNTDSVILQSQEIQVQPQVTSSGTQFSKDILDGVTQTDKENKTLSPENTGVCEIIQHSPTTAKQLIQVQPQVLSSGTQFSKDILDGVTQTDKENKTLSPENTDVCEIIQHPPTTAKKLIVQVLPSIDITKDLVIQKIHQLSMGSDKTTRVHYKSSEKNVGYFEMSVDDPLDVQLSILDIKKKVAIFKKIERQNIDYSDTNYEDSRYGVERSGSSAVITFKEATDETGSNEAVYEKDSLAMKEMVYKSFQLLDNPNKHDPGDVPHDMGITTMDTSVYKTFINPKGFPETLSDIDDKNARNDKGIFRQKISHISNAPLASRVDRPSNSDIEKPRPLSVIPSEKDESASQKINSKLWDIGLYCSKSVQCCPTVDTKNIDKPLIRQDTKGNSNRMDNTVTSASSYEKISLTISYSTETTTDSSNNSDNKPGEDTEKDLLAMDLESVARVDPKSPKDEMALSSTSGRASYNKKIDNNKTPQDYSLSKKVSPHRTNERKKIYRDRKVDQSNSVSKQTSDLKKDERQQIPRDIRIDQTYIPSASTSKSISPKASSHQDEIHDLRPSSDNEVSQFIKSLTNSKSGELRKAVPRVRQSATKDTNHEYTTLPLQIHGDCWPTEIHKKNPHLKLSDNGRYKDEANLFCKNSVSKFEDVSMRRRALHYLPRYYYKKYTLDTSNSDTVTMDETMSEGEIKCCRNRSIGEIHRCKSMYPDNKKHPHLESRSFKDDASGSVRERRTYFNHWITYYVDKKVPSVHNDSSSTSNST